MKTKLLLACIIAIGFVLRIWGMDFGLPYLLHQDEPIIVNHALAYGSGDLNPHFFIIPPLCSYILFIFYGIYFVIGKLTGLFPGAENFALRFFEDPTTLYLIARVALGLIPGMLIVLLTYVLYRRLFAGRGEPYAAAAVAISFLCVANAHYAYVDNMMVAFVLLSYLFLARMIEQPSLKNYLLPALFIGISINIKYNAGLLVFSFYIAHLLIIFNKQLDKKRIIFDGRLWMAGCVALMAFIITNPFSVLDWQFFISSVPGKIRRHYMGWTHHILYSLQEGIGLGILVLAAFGVIAIIIRKKWTKSLFFLSFPLLFYCHLAIRSQRFSRYVLPLIPFLAIAAAYFVFEILLPKTKNSLQKSLVVGLSILLLIPTAIKSVKAGLLFSGNDTRTLCTEWVEDNLSPHTKIAVDHTSFRPIILQTKNQLLRKYEIADFQKGLKKAKETKLKYLLEVVKDKKTYNVYFLTYEHEEEHRGQFLSTVPAVPYNVELLRRKGIYYVVVNYNTFNELKDEFIRALEREAKMIKAFSPYYDGKIGRRYDRIDTTCLSVGSKELFSRRLMGPCLVIYKIKTNRQ